MTDPNAMRMMQHRIRQNAMRTRDYMADLVRWEGVIKKKDAAVSSRKCVAEGKKRTPTRRKIPPVRGGGVHREVDGVTMTNFEKCNTKRHDPRLGKSFEKVRKKADKSVHESNSKGYTSKLARNEENVWSSDNNVVIVKDGAGDAVCDRAERERQRGNLHFRRGEFPEAIKCYTRAIAGDSRCVAAYCNRGFSHLKLQDYARAVGDFTEALALDSQHIKSRLRRARAFNGLGRHKAAKLDLERARAVAPTTRALKTEYAKTCELVHLAARRAPRTSVRVTTLDMIGPEKSDANDENLPTVLGPSLPKPTELKKASSKLTSHHLLTKAVDPVTTNAKSARRKAVTTLRESVTSTKKRVFSPAKTAYEFRRIWKSLARTPQRRFEYLKSVAEHSSRLFKKAIESDLFVSVIRVMNEYLDSWDELDGPLKLLDAFAKTERFEVLRMLLSRDETSLLHVLFEKIRGRCREEDKERLCGLRLQYGLAADDS